MENYSMKDVGDKMLSLAQRRLKPMEEVWQCFLESVQHGFGPTWVLNQDMTLDWLADMSQM